MVRREAPPTTPQHVSTVTVLSNPQQSMPVSVLGTTPRPWQYEDDGTIWLNSDREILVQCPPGRFWDRLAWFELNAPAHLAYRGWHKKYSNTILAFRDYCIQHDQIQEWEKFAIKQY